MNIPIPPSYLSIKKTSLRVLLTLWLIHILSCSEPSSITHLSSVQTEQLVDARPDIWKIDDKAQHTKIENKRKEIEEIGIYIQENFPDIYEQEIATFPFDMYLPLVCGILESKLSSGRISHTWVTRIFQMTKSAIESSKKILHSFGEKHDQPKFLKTLQNELDSEKIHTLYAIIYIYKKYWELIWFEKRRNLEFSQSDREVFSLVLYNAWSSWFKNIFLSLEAKDLKSFTKNLGKLLEKNKVNISDIQKFLDGSYKAWSKDYIKTYKEIRETLKNDKIILHTQKYRGKLSKLLEIYMHTLKASEFY